jgi:hypothetical protein
MNKGKIMADEIYRPQRPNTPNGFGGNNPVNLPKEQQMDLPENHPLRQQMPPQGQPQGLPPEFNNFPAGAVTGNIPPQFRSQVGGDTSGFAPMPKSQMDVSTAMVMMNANPELNAILNALKQNSINYEEVMLPSRGKFYDGTDGPTNGIIHIRPMTGEEEQILATPRFVKKNTAINMIFSKCIREDIKPENLLSQDRTFLLIYLRGISYGTDYDIQIKCPETERQFATTVDLDTLEIIRCPDNFGPNNLNGVLPKSKYKFSYRFGKGKDETDLQQYRESKIKAFSETALDDTMTFRLALLLNSVETITDKEELKVLLRNLSIQDVNYIRNIINDPPFGMETNITVLSPYSNEDFEIELPLDSGFFFPKSKKAN